MQTQAPFLTVSRTRAHRLQLPLRHTLASPAVSNKPDNRTRLPALSQTHNILHATVQWPGCGGHPAPPADLQAALLTAVSPERPHPAPQPRPTGGPYPLSSSSSSRDWVRSELQCKHHMAAAAGDDAAGHPGPRPSRELPTPVSGGRIPGATPDHSDTGPPGTRPPQGAWPSARRFHRSRPQVRVPSQPSRTLLFLLVRHRRRHPPGSAQGPARGMWPRGGRGRRTG